MTDTNGRFLATSIVPLGDLWLLAALCAIAFLGTSIEQAIKSCSSEDVPVSIELVVDTSGSMSAKLGLLKQAAIQFVRAANPYDEYFLLEFQQRPSVVLPFTTDIDQVLEAIGRMEAGGSTPLFDAVHLAVNEMRHATYPRKALLIVSDGIDNHSRYTQKETRRLISEIDFPIYTINFWERQGMETDTRSRSVVSENSIC